MSCSLTPRTKKADYFFLSSRRRESRCNCDWSSDVCSSDLMRPMVLNGGVITGNANNNAGATIGSNITLGGNLTVAVLNGANNATLTLLGNISATGGARSITKS